MSNIANHLLCAVDQPSCVNRLLYPEKLLTQHFLSPTQLEAMQATSFETKKKSFTALVQLLKHMQEDGSDQNLHSMRKIIEQVQLELLCYCTADYCHFIQVVNERRLVIDTKSPVSNIPNLPPKHLVKHTRLIDKLIQTFPPSPPLPSPPVPSLPPSRLLSPPLPPPLLSPPLLSSPLPGVFVWWLGGQELAQTVFNASEVTTRVPGIHLRE